MSSSPSTTIECDWNGNAATFDVANTAQLSDVWQSLQEVYASIGSPFTNKGASFRLTYVDSDGEEVELDSSTDLLDAIHQTQARHNRILQIFVRQPLHMTRSSLLGEGEWENVNESKVVAAPEPGVDSSSIPAPVDQSAVGQDATSSSNVDKKEEVVGSPSSGWFFGLLGGRTSAPPENVVAPVADVAVERNDNNAVVAPAASSSSPVEVESSLVTSPLSDSAVVRADSEKEFYEMNVEMDVNSQELLDEQQAQSNSFVAAMDSQFPRPVSVWDSNVLTADVLAFTFKQMLERTQTRLGLASNESVTPSASSSSIVPAASNSLLVALKDVPPERFEPVINHFVQVCAQFVEERELAAERAASERAALAAEAARRQEMEAARLEQEAHARELLRIEQIRLEAEHEARRVAEIEKQKLADLAQKRRDELAAQMQATRESMRLENEALEQMAKKMSELKQAEAEELQRLQSAQAAQPVRPQPAAEPIHAPSSMPAPPAPVDAFIDPSVYPPLAASPPVYVPMVPIPVAQPLQAQAQSAASRFNQAMQELRDMGFGDDALNTYLLQKTNLDLSATLDWLMSDQACGGELKREVQHLLSV